MLLSVPPKGPFVDGKKGKGVVKVDVVLGKEVEISCEASDAKPAATVLWYKGKFAFESSIYVGKSVVSLV